MPVCVSACVSASACVCLCLCVRFGCATDRRVGGLGALLRKKKLHLFWVSKNTLQPLRMEH